MFGLCALNRTLVLFFLGVLLGPMTVWAQAQRATVINEEALVYQQPDFDAPVITTLKAGSVYSISKGKKGAFHKIRLQPGRIGWIADSDVAPGVHKVEKEEEIKPPTGEDIKESKRKPFYATRYLGPQARYMRYVEDTLGQERDDHTFFYGLNWSGYNTVFSGDIYTDANILFHFGAPAFYSEKTGESAAGYVIIFDFLFLTTLPQSKSRMFYYGFGPMAKWTHYNLELPDGGSGDGTYYTAEDLNIGAVFNMGYAFRLGSFSLRADAKYFWEKTSYWGVGPSVGMEF